MTFRASSSFSDFLISSVGSFSSRFIGCSFERVWAWKRKEGMEFGNGGGREVWVENAEPDGFVMGLRTKCKPFLLVRV